MKDVPEFAVVGHPNEGKSSVLSTLAEDDSVGISSMPGETRECQSFPVSVDGREIIRFIDTPGFQNPQKILHWMQAYQGIDEHLIQDFIDAHQGNPDFHDDCSLLQPLLRGAGIIFVVDGSRPLRNMDRAEMEILRLTGCPRMAVINCKDEETEWLPKWQQEFRKHFNSIRIFNSCKATYGERIALLESLKSIDQDLQPVLDQVVTAFKQDWQERNRQVAELMLSFLEQGLCYSRSLLLKPGSDEAAVKNSLHREYEEYLRSLENKCQKQMRTLYKHNIFNVELSAQSILQEDLFSGKTWEFLGLNSSQLIMAGAVSGAAVGAGVDIAAAGMSFGIFSSIGALVGAAGTAIKGREILSGTQLLGMRMDNQQLRVGPVKNIQLLFILLDRQFLYYKQIVNWAHGRRDYDNPGLALTKQVKKQGFTEEWSRMERKNAENFWNFLQKNESSGTDEERNTMGQLIRKTLRDISLGENIRK